jgi:hypothetical protein
VGVGLVVALSALAVRLTRDRRIPRPAAIAAGVLVAALVLAAGYRVQRNYAEERYADEYGIGEPGLEAAFIWARDVEGSRIATNTIRQYPFYGAGLSNYVQFVGRRGDDDSFAPIMSCGAWRRALNDGDYDYVVTGANFPAPGADRPEENGWLRDAKGAKEIVSEGPTSVFELRGALDPDCSDPKKR